MKKTTLLYLILLVISASTFMTSCKKDDGDDAPVTPPSPVTTTAATNIKRNSATSGGTITSDIGTDVALRGICWGTSTTPTIDANDGTIDGDGIGTYVSEMTGLTQNTKYYVRAYSMNMNAQVTYGNEISFTTLPAPPAGSLSATVDGSPYFATFISVTSSSGTIGIAGMNGVKNLIIWLPDNLTVGSHALSTFGDYYCQYFPNSASLPIYSSDSGTINITEYNTTTGKISGTFNFNGLEVGGSLTVTVTSGLFTVYK